MPNRPSAAGFACPQLETLEDRCVPASALATGFGDWQLVAQGAVSPSVAAPNSGLGVQASGTPTAAADLSTLRAAYPGLTGAGYTVAVIDTGIDYLHPALGGGFGVGKKVVAGQNFVVNGNGYVSNYAANNPLDENGHGTNVAGIIAAKDATYSGVAPDANLVALRVLDKNGRGTWEWVDQALQWVISNRVTYHIDAVNMSLGSGNYSGMTSDFLALDAKLATLWSAGVVNVASGGNDFFRNASVPGLQFPAVSTSVVSVGAVFDGNYGARTWASGAIDSVSYKDKIASFTQRSAGLQLLAPGALVTSAGLSYGGTANYWTYAGSSQASPFVAGASILVKQAYATQGQGAAATPTQIRNVLMFTGDKLLDAAPAAEDNVTPTGLTFPRLNVVKAVQFVASSFNPGGGADSYEYNDTQTAARFLGQVGAASAFNANFHTVTDVDWYSFTPQAAGSYRLEITGSAGAALGFYSAPGGSETVGAATAGGARLDATLAAGRTYWVRTAGRAAGTYRLSIAANAAAPAPAPDAFEANETIAAAKALGAFGNTTRTGLTLHTGADQDWFRFTSTVQATRRIQVVSETSAGAATFTFQDVTRGRERTLNATFVNGVATLDVPLRTGVNYFLNVRTAAGRTTAYRVVTGAA